LDEEKKGFTIYEDGSMSGGKEEFAAVIMPAIKKNPEIVAFFGATLDVHLMLNDPIAWMNVHSPQEFVDIVSAAQKKAIAKAAARFK